MNVIIVVGARPNFMKAAPVIRGLAARGVTATVVHTGQHYDESMSDAFLTDLAIDAPDVHLGVGSGSHAEQTARVMERFDPVVAERAPDLVVVVGDVNSTMAAALVCAKLGRPVAHVEAGLRSFDRTMPEEINRLVTDQVSDLLFTTSPEAEENLRREGVASERIHFVGNPMIDSLERHLARARETNAAVRLGVADGPFAVMTLHRPSNVDDPATLAGILGAVSDVARSVPVIFPAHPRTRRVLKEENIDQGSIVWVEPLGYLDFLGLMASARLVLTDSGGIQEETTILGVPCLTLRWNTERPITITMGTNRLVGNDPERIRREALAVLDEPAPAPVRPPLWDGKAGERIADLILAWHRRA